MRYGVMTYFLYFCTCKLKFKDYESFLQKYTTYCLVVFKQ